MKKFTLYTETRDNLATIVSAHFDNFTLINGTGYYKGGQELSTQIIVIVTDESKIIESARLLGQVAVDIKTKNNQECVLVTEENLIAKLV